MSRVASPRPDGSREELAGDARRLRGLRLLVLILLGLLLVSLGWCQLARRDHYTARERRQSLRRVMIPAPRGAIYDREHRLLAGNRVTWAAVINPGDLLVEFRHAGGTASARAAVLQRYQTNLERLLSRPAAGIDLSRFERQFARERLLPWTLADELSPSEIDQLASLLPAESPIRVQATRQRWHPHPRAAAHVLGRLRDQLIRTPNGPYFPTLNYRGEVGDSGLELQHEDTLRGQDGEEVVWLDALGFPVGPPQNEREAVAGRNLETSLDLDLQLAAERLLAAATGASSGAAVALAVDTGEVLALASKPDFDFNAIELELAPDMKRQLDAAGVWLNRATQGVYAPGSTFKIFTALAGLRAGTLHPDTVIPCAGGLVIGGRRFACHNADGHGPMVLRRALAQSCNVFAYQTGLDAGAAALAAEARRFHLDAPTGLDLPGETNRMSVPDSTDNSSDDGRPWGIGDTANFAIGQGALRYSPLQAACAIASLARRETLTVPTLLHSPRRRPSGDRPPEPLDLSDENYRALIDGMREVIASGIGRDAQVPGVDIAGKTGTAQVAQLEGTKNVAWFIAYAPVEKPEIAIAVALEGGRPGQEYTGGEHAAPIVRGLLETYFDKRGK